MWRPSPAVDLARAAVDQAAGPIVIADALGRLTYCDQAMSALLGLPLDGIRGRYRSRVVARGGTFFVDWLYGGSQWPFCCNTQQPTLGGHDNTFSSDERT